MATEILATGTAAADSADVVIAAGSQLTVALKPTIDNDYYQARVSISLKDDAGTYIKIDQLSSPGRVALVIAAAGTYRFSRIDTGVSCGVFSG